MKNKTSPYPFIKWAGGKSRVSSRILARLPDKIDTYFEPFLGGGAVFFELARTGRFKKAILSDMNPSLHNCWGVVKNDVEGLIKELKKKKYEYEKSAYLKIRSTDVSNSSQVEQSARFIFLNRTCFNGLYRVNSSGEFNVPFGKYTDPVICDEENLRSVSQILKNVQILKEDFESSCIEAKKGDAVYFDPPYIPISKTSKFTAYTQDGFSLRDHERLEKLFGELSSKGVRCVLSNSESKEAVSLFEKYDYETFKGTRSVGGHASFRKSAGEIIAYAGPRNP